MARGLRCIGLIIPLWLIQHIAPGQNYIGTHKDDIRKLMPKEHRGFVFEKEVENGDRSFVKFVNTLEEQTLLFMVNSRGICTSVSRMYNTWLYEQLQNEFKKIYTPRGQNTWVERKNGKEYEVKLKRGQWFLTVTTRPLTKN